MEEKEIITVENKDNKGNPNHKPAGSPEGGQFTSANDISGGSKKEKMLAFLKAKKEKAAIKKDFSSGVNNILLPHVYDEYLKKGVVNSFELGTDKAKEILLSHIQKNNIKIQKGNGSYCKAWGDVYFDNPSLTSSGKYGTFHAPGDTFWHEFFHSIDFKTYSGGTISTTYKLDNGNTLKSIFQLEISENKYGWSMKMFNEIKENVEKEKEEALNAMYSPEEVAQIKKDLNCQTELNKKYSYLNGTSLNGMYAQDWVEYKNERKRLFKEVLNPALEKYGKAINPVNQKWVILSDFCSYLYKTGVKNSICGGHDKEYWSGDFGNRPIKEMFAELGSMWARDDKEGIERVRKYFPKTVDGFMEIINKISEGTL